jgi:hypothetical protein
MLSNREGVFPNITATIFAAVRDNRFMKDCEFKQAAAQAATCAT